MNAYVRSLLAKIVDPVERIDAMEKWSERAAIIEFCGNKTRAEAEDAATAELKAKVKE